MGPPLRNLWRTRVSWLLCLLSAAPATLHAAQTQHSVPKDAECPPAAPLPAVISLADPPEFDPTPLLRVYGDDSGDGFGGSWSNGIAYGDVNGDGFDDLVTGAYLASPGGRFSAGEVYIIYGSVALSGGLLSMDASPGSNGETRIYGDTSDDLAGLAVATGDIDADGFDDVIIGAYKSDPGGREDAGEVYVIYGGIGLPGAEVDLSSPPGTHGETRILGDDTQDGIGVMVASGDLNGDGFDDILLGGEEIQTGGDTLATGEVYVVYGSATLAGTVVDLNVPGVHNETRIHGDNEFDHLGFAVSPADVNGDGFADLVMTAHHFNFAGRNNSGAVYVVYGGVSLPGKTFDLSQPLGSMGETRIYGDNANDNAGWSMATGDTDADGYQDIIIGVPFADPANRDAAGEVYIVYGSASLPKQQIDLGRPVGTFGETRLLGGISGENAGWAVASGDVNGDGFADVIVGGAYNQPGFGNRPGKVYVIEGGPSLRNRSIQMINAAAVTILPGELNGELGHGIESGGDLNRDGATEFATSIPFGVSPGNIDTGYVLNVFGTAPAPSATVREAFPIAISPLRGMGGRLSPVIRARLGFNTPGTGGHVEATIFRSDASISGIGAPAQTADVLWRLASPRRFGKVELQYLDCEIQSLDEAQLRLWRAPAPAGPWTPVPAANFDHASNIVTAAVNDLGYFALSTVEVAPGCELGDTTPPVITLIGPPGLGHECGDVYIDPGATAMDDCSGDISAGIGVFNPVTPASLPGTYFVRYFAADGAGNLSQAMRTVTVLDHTEPVVTLIGAAEISVPLGSTYVEPGAFASDVCDTDVAVSIGGDTVNTGVAGTYRIAYDAVDAFGNAAQQQVRTVHVLGTDQPPILSNPTALTVDFGAAAQFTVTAASLSAVSYQWLKNGTPLQDSERVAGAQTPSLVLSDVTYLDEAGYSVTAGNAGGTVISQPAQLTVIDPLIVVEPANQFAGPGASAEIFVEAVGSGSLAYQWFRFGVPLQESSKYTGTATPLLQVHDLNLEDHLNQFHAVITGPGGAAVTRTALLRVTDPWFTRQPQPTFASPGHTVQFATEVIGTLPIVYQWRRNGENLNNGGKYSGVHTPILTISGVEEADSGEFLLLAVGQNVVESEPAALIVSAAPVLGPLSVTPAGGVVPIGGTAQLEITVLAGSEPFAYAWRRNGQLVDGAGDPLFSIQHAQQGQGGLYTVTVSNSAGSARSTPAALVIGLTLLGALEDRVVEAGEGLSWQANIQGATGAVSYQWRREIDGVFQDIQNGAGISGATSPTLVLTDVDFADEGRYRLEASDDTGTVVAEAQLTVVEMLPVSGASVAAALLLALTVFRATRYARIRSALPERSRDECQRG